MSKLSSLDFEPSSFYIYEQQKHNYAARVKSDRMKMFQRMQEIWHSNAFLKNNKLSEHNGSSNAKAREGRKLQLAEFNQVSRKQEVVKK